MNSFNIFVLRRVENQFPFFVSLSEEKCHEHARLYHYDMTGLEVAEVIAVAPDFIASVLERLDRIQAATESMGAENRGLASSLTRAVIKVDALEDEVRALTDERDDLRLQVSLLKSEGHED